MTDELRMSPKRQEQEMHGVAALLRAQKKLDPDASPLHLEDMDLEEEILRFLADVRRTDIAIAKAISRPSFLESWTSWRTKSEIHAADLRATLTHKKATRAEVGKLRQAEAHLYRWKQAYWQETGDPLHELPENELGADLPFSSIKKNETLFRGVRYLRWGAAILIAIGTGYFLQSIGGFLHGVGSILPRNKGASPSSPRALSPKATTKTVTVTSAQVPATGQSSTNPQAVVEATFEPETRNTFWSVLSRIPRIPDADVESETESERGLSFGEETRRPTRTSHKRPKTTASNRSPAYPKTRPRPPEPPPRPPQRLPRFLAPGPQIPERQEEDPETSWESSESDSEP